MLVLYSIFIPFVKVGLLVVAGLDTNLQHVADPHCVRSAASTSRVLINSYPSNFHVPAIIEFQKLT